MKLKIDQCGSEVFGCTKYVVQFPPRLLEVMKWKEGDNLVADINIHGDLVLSKEEAKGA